MSYDVYSTAGLTPPGFFPVSSQRDPVNKVDVSDQDGAPYRPGQPWVNVVLTKYWIYAGAGQWVLQAVGTKGPILTITGDTGGAEPPTAATGNFNIKGTANQVLVAGTAATETISLIGPYTPATYTAHGVLVGEGTSAIVATTPGTDGQVLTGNTSADPTFDAIGTKSGLTAHGVIVAEGASAFVATAAGTTGQVLTATTSADPAFSAIGTGSGLTAHGVLLAENASAFVATAAGTTGQVLTGVTGADPVWSNATTSNGTFVGKFDNIPSMSASTGGVAAVTINTYNIWAVPQWSASFEQYNTTVATNIAPVMSATAGNGLNIDNIGGAVSKTIEITEGNTVNSKNAFVIGTSAAFFVKAGFNVATLADVTDFYVGFRKVQTYQATVPAGYTDYATIGIHGTSGLIELQTQVGSGGNTITSTTQSATAATIFTVEVLVSGAGVVTYLLNGSTPTAVAAYTFTNALTVIPYIIYTTPAGGHAEADLVSYQCGFQ